MDHLDVGQIFTYLSVLILACFGGVVDFVNELKDKREKHPVGVILFSLFARLLSAGFAGLLMYWVLQANTKDGIVILNGMSAFSIAISGFLGDQAIKFFVSVWTNFTKGGR